MDSNDAFELWKLKHQELVQQLTPQPGESAEKLELARRNLGRAERALADADPDQALISAEAAMHSRRFAWPLATPRFPADVPRGLAPAF